MSARLSAGRWLAVTAGVLVAVALLGIALALNASSTLTDARQRLVDRIDPALVAVLRLETALINQETGVRGFLLGGDEAFLAPYRTGGREQAAARATLAGIVRQDPGLGFGPAAAAIDEAEVSWRARYAEPVIDRVRRSGPPRAEQPALAAVGKSRFDLLRSRVDALQARVADARRTARAQLDDDADALDRSLLLIGVLLLAAIGVAVVIVRIVVTRPLGALAASVRDVAAGDPRTPVAASGPRDVRALGADVEAMRRRIVDELEAVGAARRALAEQAEALERSNAELEQFAYVASHDLQEPLRKVTSFSQMLQRRYGGQLDDRADQYIEYAVDGAKRMQVLINDLLAFSRVGRMTADWELLDLDDLLAQATDNLATAIEETGARIDVEGDLPEVRGERSLLVLVLQNLVGNGIKFRGDEAPRVRVSCTTRDGEHEIVVRDNGIGIDAEYGERIFVIFQRLHTKDQYAGTGIGLAMCRKVVEYHGGRIWLDDDAPGPGATFRFTLPVPTPEEPAA